MNLDEASFSTYTDTDTTDIRLERLQKEEDMYINLGEYMKGKSIVERITEIRETVFGDFGDVKGDKVTKVREGNVEAGGFLFVPLDNEGSMRLFGDLTKQIDRLYEYLIKDSEERVDTIEFDKVVRFSSIVYSLGVTLHPYIDGNGQTFRIAAISYISELAGVPYRLKNDSKIDSSAPTQLVEHLPKNLPIGESTREQVMEGAYSRLSDELKFIANLKMKKPTKPLLKNEHYGLSQAILSIPTQTKMDPLLMDKAKRWILKTAPQGWEKYLTFIFTILETFPSENFDSLEEIYNYPSKISIPSLDNATRGIYKHSESEQVELLKKYLQDVLTADEYHRMFIEFIDTGIFDPGSSIFGNVLLGVLKNTERQIRDMCEKIPLNNEEGI